MPKTQSVVQLWFCPALGPLGQPPFTPSDGISIRTMLLEKVGDTGEPSQKFLASLMEIECQLEPDLGGAFDYFKRAGHVFLKLSFASLQQFTVIAARAVARGLKEGDHSRELVPGAPPMGLLPINTQLRGKRTAGAQQSLFSTELAPDLESAMSWLVKGISSANAIDQFLCHWIGLEVLAPDITGPYRCKVCTKDIPKCPHCGENTDSPKATQAIRSFLESKLGVSRPEFKQLYTLRNNISHGNLAQSFEGVEDAVGSVARIQNLLLLAIKQRLGWKESDLPQIESEWTEWEGQTFMIFEDVVGPKFYDTPPLFYHRMDIYDMVKIRQTKANKPPQKQAGDNTTP